MAKLSVFLPLSATLIVVFALASPSGAYAGFEWKGPVEKPIPAVPSAPAITEDDMKPLAPVTGDIQWSETEMPAAPAPVVETGAVGAVQAEKTTVVSAPAGGEDILSGFGSEIPLVIALQQIVPAGFQFSFSAGVNPGSPITWEGGKTWKDVLADSLLARGLSYVIEKNTVVVNLVSSPKAPESAFVPAPAPLEGRKEEKTSKADQIPQDLIAPEEKAAATPPSLPAPVSAPVDIRREKPTDLLNRLKKSMGEKKEETKEEVKEEKKTKEDSLVVSKTVEKKPALAPLPLAPVTEAMPASPSVAVSSAATAAPQVIEPAWHGAMGQTLREVLEDWSKTAGVDLYWSIDYDYRLGDDVAFGGNYDEAVGKLLDRFAAARPQPYGQLHEGEKSPRVLVIKSYDLR